MSESQTQIQREQEVEVVPAQVQGGHDQAAESNGVETAAAQFHEQQEKMKALHKSCAEGDVMAVRGVLSSSMELLESIDPATGHTPMLQAIYASQVEVVKELMMAGAYPPPPSVTQDPAILAILYPPQIPSPQYGLPPASGHFVPGPSPVQPSEFGYYGHPQEHTPFPGGQHRQSMSQERGNDAAKLPPVEVAKSIPCRNFPNCRFGDACVFQHPQAFYPPAPYQPAEFAHGGFPVMPMFYGMPPASPFVPLDAQTPAFAPPMIHRQSLEVNGVAAPSFVPQNDLPPSANGQNLNHVQQQAPQFHPRGNQSPFPPQNGFDASKKPHHVKRMSFGGNPKGTWIAPNGAIIPAGVARQAALGSWSNGQPPACVFFQNSKCRNGEMCKFPHIMPDGTDSRHPDVIAGTVAAAPVSTNPHFRPPTRGRMAGNGNFQFERQQHFLKMQALRQQQSAARPTQSTAEEPLDAEKAETGEQVEKVDQAVSEEKLDDVKSEAGQGHAAFLGKVQGLAQMSSRTRSVPNTRAHSPTSNGPAGSRVSRASSKPAHFANAHAARSSSIPALKDFKQKVPSPDDFPTLGGSVNTLNGDSVVIVKAGPYGGKTAAQVLSAPAPPKPVSNKEDELKKIVSRESSKSIGHNVSTESDDEAVVISLKDKVETPASEPTSTAVATPASPSQPPMSFASIAGKISAAADASSMVSIQA